MCFTAVGDSLRCAEGQPDLPFREACSFPGAWVKDVSRKLPSLIQSSDDYPLFFVHVSSDVVMISSREITGDFKAFGGLVEE